ncbi:5-methyltetrahydropteroyltriglutamate--homocysteine methyltransferase [Thermocatellispora tengchongensis]|uniref:5-methyltetrahydropteroyltriglutamate--homocysteine methyltransferase n=1 Tax=Thermocatellispora tengchongensis TaxID=1073253 RepID=A0A840P1Y0_9ACTN|nr:cobalamin-independent methionine synthase II family protein [Thermocatellispora tengchongensis]MBB5133698.1 5-methyltetrahydropteroyltriglutamate--homocysteine methyltransferase [Thermocatellispora tengchongensis]
MSASTVRCQAIGSLLRPGYLVSARAEFKAGRITAAEMKAVEDRAAEEALRLQEAAGLDVVNDGEMRRTSFMDHLLATVPGALEHEAPIEADSESGGTYTVDNPIAVVERITPARNISVEEYVYLRGRTDRPIKITVPSPLMLYAFWSAERSSAAYPDPFDLFTDWTALLRAQIEELAALGCTRVQIDAPDMALLVDEEQRQAREALGISVERTVIEGCELIDSLAATPGVSVSLHLCKGNFRSMWAASGGYDRLAKRIFDGTPHVETYLLEYDDERSGGFAPLADLPEDKHVVLGLVSTKRDELEPLDALLARVNEAARYVDRERIGVSPQCGFASVAAGANLISPAMQAAKLFRVAELAAAL